RRKLQILPRQFPRTRITSETEQCRLKPSDGIFFAISPSAKQSKIIFNSKNTPYPNFCLTYSAIFYFDLLCD
ncbi:TPA: hypothetical protein ACFO23_002088, partial [Neisseria meningitidis]